MTIFLGSKIISAKVTAFITGTLKIYHDLDKGAGAAEEFGNS